VYAADSGNEYSPEVFDLHLSYWGNPPGVGCGFRAQDPLHPFGEVPPATAVIAHVEGCLAGTRLQQGPEFFEVERHVIGPINQNTVGIVERTRWRFRKDPKTYLLPF
jgi:hypothetical protein